MRIHETGILGENKFNDIHCAQIDNGCCFIGIEIDAWYVSP